MISRAQEETNLKAFDEGRRAYLGGDSFNPYPAASPYYSFWKQGHEYARSSGKHPSSKPPD